MTLASNVLNYQDSNNKTVIKLYTSLSDIYTGKGLPVEYRGNQLYAPLVPLSDVYATPIKFEDASGEYAVAFDTVKSNQEYYSNKVTEISLSGNSTKEKTHDTFAIVAPYSGKYHLNVTFRGGQNGWGYSGDKWQYAYFYLDIDTENIVRKELRRSQGMGWKTLYDGDIELVGGTHILKIRMFGKSSSKDSHLTACYEWKSKLTILQGE